MQIVAKGYGWWNSNSLHFIIYVCTFFFSNYSKNNITSNIYTVNSAWLFSLYWCVGVDSVLTDYCHVLNKQESPVWNMVSNHFRPWFLFLVDFLMKLGTVVQKLTLKAQLLSSALSSVGYFKSYFCKQCGPRSDCCFRSSLIWVHTVCLYAKISLFVCVCWGFTAQSTQWGHVERGQFT